VQLRALRLPTWFRSVLQLDYRRVGTDGADFAQEAGAYPDDGYLNVHVDGHAFARRSWNALARCAAGRRSPEAEQEVADSQVVDSLVAVSSQASLAADMARSTEAEEAEDSQVELDIIRSDPVVDRPVENIIVGLALGRPRWEYVLSAPAAAEEQEAAADSRFADIIAEICTAGDDTAGAGDGTEEVELPEEVEHKQSDEDDASTVVLPSCSPSLLLPHGDNTHPTRWRDDNRCDRTSNYDGDDVASSVSPPLAASPPPRHAPTSRERFWAGTLLLD